MNLYNPTKTHHSCLNIDSIGELCMYNEHLIDKAVEALVGTYSTTHMR